MFKHYQFTYGMCFHVAPWRHTGSRGHISRHRRPQCINISKDFGIWHWGPHSIGETLACTNVQQALSTIEMFRSLANNVSTPPGKICRIPQLGLTASCDLPSGVKGCLRDAEGLGFDGFSLMALETKTALVERLFFQLAPRENWTSVEDMLLLSMRPSHLPFSKYLVTEQLGKGPPCALSALGPHSSAKSGV